MFDIIGDIHGHAEQLRALLGKLGYIRQNGSYHHPGRKIIFLGDYIDRGPQIRETLEIIRSMVDNGDAIAIMGNHEYNAICFNLKIPDGGYLRKHSVKNILQHFRTLEQFRNRQKEYNYWVDWFRTLPLIFETEQFRAVHACWDDSHISLIKERINGAGLKDDFLLECNIKGTPLHNAVEDTLKGKEIILPGGLSFEDKDGMLRNEIRIRWWLNPTEVTYKEYSIIPMDELPDRSLTDYIHEKYYDEKQKPVFFGHYWLKGLPELCRENICCMDYSVAKGGYLAAYRYDGEVELHPGKFFYV